MISLSLLIAILLSFGGCSTFKDTPETDAAFAAYEAAIKQSIAHKKGAITVVTENEDTVVENKNSIGIIEYSFTTDEAGKVSFERNDFTNGEEVAAYRGDGKAAYQMDLTTGKWVDVTETSGAMLNHDKNIFNNLSLFRIDNNFRYSKRFYESVSMEEAEGEKIITVVIKNKELNAMFDLSDEKEIRREMCSQTRKFYVGEDGDLYKISIETLQNVTYKEKSGTLSNKIDVTLNYED